MEKRKQKKKAKQTLINFLFMPNRSHYTMSRKQFVCKSGNIWATHSIYIAECFTPVEYVLLWCLNNVSHHYRGYFFYPFWVKDRPSLLECLQNSSYPSVGGFPLSKCHHRICLLFCYFFFSFSCSNLFTGRKVSFFLIRCLHRLKLR